MTNLQLANLQHDLNNKTDYHLRVGAVTSKLLLTTLSANGLHSSALKVATQTTEPSWGYWLSQNATTCFEAWPGATDGSTSRNHIFLCGGVGEWMWKELVGLAPTMPGQFSHLQHRCRNYLMPQIRTAVPLF